MIKIKLQYMKEDYDGMDILKLLHPGHGGKW